MIDKQVLLFILLNYSYKFVSCYNSCEFWYNLTFLMINTEYVSCYGVKLVSLLFVFVYYIYNKRYVQIKPNKAVII